LPALPRLARRWDLLYSLDQHGISLRTLYARCSEPTRKGGPRPALLIVKDAPGDSFGAFVGEGIHPSPANYYGGGESYVQLVFQMSFHSRAFTPRFLWRADGNVTHVFRWTGRNDYVALCDTDSISFGGGSVLTFSVSLLLTDLQRRPLWTLFGRRAPRRYFCTVPDLQQRTAMQGRRVQRQGEVYPF
jgi:hypothetical protein